MKAWSICESISVTITDNWTKFGTEHKYRTIGMVKFTYVSYQQTLIKQQILYRKTAHSLSNALNVQVHSETDASLASSRNCRHWATGLWGRQAAHSRPSDRRRRTPNGRACCDDVVVQRDGGGWKIEVADDWQRPMWGGSSSREWNSNRRFKSTQQANCHKGKSDVHPHETMSS